MWFIGGAFASRDARYLGVGLDLDLPGFAASRTYAVRDTEIALQHDQLVQTQVAPLAGTQIFRGDAGVRDARQTHHERTRCLTETTHLTVASFAERELEPSFVSFITQAAHFGGRRSAAIDFDALPPFEQLFVEH